MPDQLDKSARERALIEKFRSVSIERLDHLNLAVLELETHPDRLETCEEAMREIHTLKGEAKLVGFPELSATAHKAEELLVLAKAQDFRSRDEVFDLLLRGFDAMRKFIEAGVSHEESHPDMEKFSFEVDTVLAVEKPEPVAEDTRRSHPPAPTPPAAMSADEAITKLMRIRTASRIRVELDKVEQLTDLVGDLVQDQTRRAAFERQLRQIVDPWTEEIQKTLALLRDLRQGAARGQGGAASEIPATADRDDLQELCNRLEERLERQGGRVAKLRALFKSMGEATFKEGLRISQLEERFREIRMQPLSSLFGTFPRAVRDLGRELGKQILLEIRGEEVEVDQQILERIKEPLLHLIRNSVDHGVEAPEERREAGKPAEGVIRIEATQRGPHVQLSVSDDGRGLDPQALRREAVARGLLSDEAAAALASEDALELIFQPGFTTRHKASEISGRGVGLDAVRSEIEALGGTVGIRSELGVRLTFVLAVPVSAAFQRVLLFAENHCTYAVPAASVVCLMRISPRDLKSAAGSQVFDVEGDVLPAMDLNETFGTSDTIPAVSDSDNGDEITLVVVDHGGRRIGLRVERLLGERSLVHRKLDPFLENQTLVVGSAVLGEGRTVLLLSVPELVSLGRPARRSDRAEPRQQRILVVDDSDLTREVFVRVLRRLGHHTQEATNGQHALTLMGEELPDLVLLDLDMPVMSGFELLERMRGEDKTKSIPAIVLSGDGAAKDQDRCRDLGADAFLVKSAFREPDLAGLLDQFLGKEAGRGKR